MQVLQNSVRHIKFEEDGTHKVVTWSSGDNEIVAAATNSRQLVVVLTSSHLVYFELDAYDTLNEYEGRH